MTQSPQNQDLLQVAPAVCVWCLSEATSTATDQMPVWHSFFSTVTFHFLNHGHALLLSIDLFVMK